MQKSPLISVIIPTFNSEKTLDVCISSVLRQTFENFELIIVDDDSMDGTQDFCRCIKDKRVTYFRKENEGPGAARNFGIEKAKGKWIYCLDSDDFIDHKFFERVAAAVCPDIDVVLTNFAVYNDALRCQFPAGWALRHANFFSDDSKKRFTFEDCPELFFETVQNVPWNKMVRKSLMEKNNIAFQNLFLSEDMAYSLSSCVLAKNIVRLMSENVIHREYAGTSSMDNKFSHPLDFLESLVYLLDFLKKNELFDVLRCSYLRWALNSCVYNMTTHFDEDALTLQTSAIATKYSSLFLPDYSSGASDVFFGLGEDYDLMAGAVFAENKDSQRIFDVAKSIRDKKFENRRFEKQKKLCPLVGNSIGYRLVKSAVRWRENRRDTNIKEHLV